MVLIAVPFKVKVAERTQHLDSLFGLLAGSQMPVLSSQSLLMLPLAPLEIM